jgi:hypothetical protein
MFKIERLVWAMAEHEGWLHRGMVAGNEGSLSYRNHNPLNLRRSPFAVGMANNFAVFKTDMDGFAAAVWDIRQKAIGNTSTGLNGESTLRDLIHVWAPPSDGNDPAAYLQDVCFKSGLLETVKLKDLIE